MSERLKALADAGVSIWLDDLSRERIETGNLADLVKNSSVVGVTTNPTIFASALSDGERYDDQVRELAAGRQGRRTRRSSRSPRPTSATPATCSATPSRPRGGVDGRVSIEVSPGLAHDDRRRPSPRPRSCGRRSTATNLFIKIPATTEGAPGDHRRARRGHQRQRHADLRARPLRRGDGRLPRGLEKAKANGQGPVEDPLGRVVLRLPRRHRDRQAARRPPATPRPATCWAWPASPTPGSPTRPTRRSSRGDRFAAARRRRRQHAASAVGVDRREEPGLPRHDVRHRPRRRRTP